jgi:hypothetical protein
MSDDYPVTLIIDAGHLVATLRGKPEPDDREYFAALLLAVYDATKKF